MFHSPVVRLLAALEMDASGTAGSGLMDSGPDRHGPLAGDATTLHVRRAVSGDTESLSWIVERFTPLLLSQATVRLPPFLRQTLDPEDLVQETWAVALPRLSSLSSRNDRFTPVLVRFLSQTLLHIFNAHARKAARRMALRDNVIEERRQDPVQGLTTAIVARERDAALTKALGALDERDRQIIVLRLIEQQPVAAVARLLSISETAVTSRLHRALKRLKDRIGPSVLDELLP